MSPTNTTPHHLKGFGNATPKYDGRECWPYVALLGWVGIRQLLDLCIILSLLVFYSTNIHFYFLIQRFKILRSKSGPKKFISRLSFKITLICFKVPNKLVIFLIFFKIILIFFTFKIIIKISQDFSYFCN